MNRIIINALYNNIYIYVCIQIGLHIPENDDLNEADSVVCDSSL